MKLFSSTQISWAEPWFFLIRIREAWGWRRRILLAIGISIVMFLGIYFLGNQIGGLPGTIGISLAAGYVLVALLDVGNVQRDVTVYDDRIVVSSSMGRGWSETFKFDAVNGIQLMHPADWGKPYGGMLIAVTNDTFLVAVPNKVPLGALANILDRLGLAVTLTDWEPSDSDTRVGITDEIELDPASVHGEIDIQPVEDHEGPLLAPWQIAIQVVIGLGPLFLALIGAIVVGVILFRNWEAMSVLDKSLYGGGAFIAVVTAFVYLILVGQFIAASYGISASRKRMQTRPNAMFGGMEDDLVVVELFARESWTATVSKSTDFGFLRIDRQQAKLLFEGNKFRWTLPISALATCRIEESIVGSEADENADKRYYVVIEAGNNGESWETGMIYTRTELGNDIPESRYNRAQLLFTQLAEAL
ncbi:MAG: hypothetical protein HON53_19965 [Planctomycetaceae bacterium]|jgi:hypothetical protein|nr:hypothetical protein [Planctomycetaceae bacterium]MBT6153315.1 hypothetical protein [Planctomycetaceae bacterium]MBT6483234.1 hypothetical protein [Planctomycetaceae bacterium]MBT6492909.1 hypothetical protein [Planctomycetaceae bacterium]